MHRTLGLSAGLSLCLLVASGCAKLYDMKYVGVGADYWFPKLSGDIELNSGTLNGTEIDVDDTMDLGDENAVNIHAAVQIWNVTVDASYFELDYSGSNTLSETITFGGQTFVVGTQLDSDVEIQYGSIKAKAGLLEVGYFAVGALLGVNYVKLDADLRTPIISGQDALESPFPVVGAVATVNVPLGDTFGFFADVEVSGLYIDAFDIEGSFLDSTARVGLKASVFRFGGAYRYMMLDFEDSDDDFIWDFELGGPFVFAELVF